MTLTPIAIYLILRFIVAKVFIVKLPEVSMMTATFAERLLTMPAIYFFYIKTFLFPKDLFIFQNWIVSRADQTFFIPLILDILFLSLIAGIGYWIFKKHKNNLTIYIFFVFWFLIGIGFHLQILPLDMTVADHMFYFPMIGLLGILGLTFNKCNISNNMYKHVAGLTAIIIICIFSLRTMARNADWNNGITLFGHDLQYQYNDQLEGQYAAALSNAGQNQEAQKHFTILLTHHPKDPAYYLDLGLSYVATGNLQQAENILYQGIPYDDSGDIYQNLGAVLLKDNKVKPSAEITAIGAHKFPKNVAIWLAHALAEYRLGDKQKALDEVKKTRSFSSDPRIDQIYNAIQSDTVGQ
jgi:Tfp pilus assembly protein PilF